MNLPGRDVILSNRFGELRVLRIWLRLLTTCMQQYAWHVRGNWMNIAALSRHIATWNRRRYKSRIVL